MGANPGNAANWVQTDNSYLKVENTAGELVDAQTLSEIPSYPKFELKIVYRVPENTSITVNDEISYTLPTWISKLDVTSGDVKFGSKVIGNWKIEDGKVVIHYTDAAFLDKYKETGFVGSIGLSGLVQASYSSETTTWLDLNYLGLPEGNFKVVERSIKIRNMDVKKAMVGGTDYDVVSDNFAKQTYEVKVKAGKYDDPNVQQNNGDLENVYIHDDFRSFEKWQYRNEAEWRVADDLLDSYLSYAINFSKIIDGSGLDATDGRKLVAVQNAGTASETVVDPASVTGEITWKLVNADGTAAVLRPDEQIVINYEAVVNKEFLEVEARGYSEDLDDHYSGKADNATKQKNNSNRSWTIRKIENKVDAHTSSILKDDKTPADFFAECNELNKQTIKFDKTWLWKNGDPQGNYQSSYIIKVNEGTVNKIKDWILTDNLNDYDQELLTDVVIRYKSGGEFVEEAKLSKASLSDNVITYQFKRNAEYEITFGAQFKESARTGDKAHGKVECLNGAVLTEADENSTAKDTFGVYETHTISGNTITKRYDERDIQGGTISWITTIDAARSEKPEDLVVKAGAVYRDFLGWKRTDSEGGTEYACEKSKGVPYRGTYAETRTDHYVNTDQDVMQIVVTAETKDGKRTLVRGEDYEVRSFDEVDAAENLKNWNDAKRVGEEVCDGFDVVFKKDIDGNIQISYRTVADFADVTYSETFTNRFLYYPNGTEFASESLNNFKEASTTYNVYGAIKKTNVTPENTKSATVEWQIDVNDEKYEVKQLQVRDTIPREFDFALTKDCLEFQEIVEGVNGVKTWAVDKTPYQEAWDAAFADSDTIPGKPGISNDLFIVTYDENTRQLRILIKNTYQRYYKIKLKTTLSMKTLESLMTSTEERSINNTAWIYSNDGVDDADSTGKTLDISHWSANATLTGQVLEKRYAKYNMPYATYVLEVNSAGVKMSDTGRITLSDTVGSNQMILMPNSITVRKGSTPNLNADNVMEEINKLGALSTGEYTVNVDTQNDVARGFSIDLPDEEPLVVTYDVYIVGEINESVSLSNSAKIAYGENKSITVPNETTQTVGNPDFNTEVPNQINVEKVDKADYSTKLKDAEFTIYNADENGAYVGTFVSGKNGIANSLSNAVEADKAALRNLKNGVHYVVKETKAPYGYDIDQSFAVTFLFYTGDESKDGKAIDPVAEHNKGVKIIYLGVADYTVIARDEKLPTVEIPVEKTWINDFETYRPDEIVFALKYSVEGMEKPDYAKDANGGKIILRMNESNLDEDAEDANIWRGSFKNLPAVDADGNTITYYVEEENVYGYLTEYGDTTEIECDLTSDQFEKEENSTNYLYKGAFDVGNRHLDFTRTIKGIAWKDLTSVKDGLLENGDAPLPGVTVSLWLKMGDTYIQAKDRNGKDVEPITVGADGAYEFTNLLEGTYEVRFEQDSYITKQQTNPELARPNNSIAEQLFDEDGNIRYAVISDIVLPNDKWMDDNKNNLKARYGSHPYMTEGGKRTGAMFLEDHCTYVLPWQNAGFIEFAPIKKELPV